MNSNIRELREASWRNYSKYLSWAIALVSLGITIYLGFIKKNEPKLEYDIVSSTTFINNKESAAYLKILIDTVDIQESHLNISAFNIKVENKGSENITYYNYDKGFFGLKLTNGTLLEPPTLIEASNDHIRRHFPQSDSIVDNTVVEVPALSLDKGDYYIMRLVLLHSVDSMPSFQTEGKIVGQKKIVVNDYNAPAPNFFLITFGGNWLVQVVRFISYLIGIVVVIALIVVTGVTVDTIQERHRRKKVLKELSGKNLLKFVKDDFIKNGSENIEQAHKIYNNTEVDITKKYIKSKKIINGNQRQGTKNRSNFSIHWTRYRHISELIEKGYLVLNDDETITFNKEAKHSVRILYPYLAAKNMLDLHRYEYVELASQKTEDQQEDEFSVPIHHE